MQWQIASRVQNRLQIIWISIEAHATVDSHMVPIVSTVEPLCIEQTWPLWSVKQRCKHDTVINKAPSTNCTVSVTVWLPMSTICIHIKYRFHPVVMEDYPCRTTLSLASMTKQDKYPVGIWSFIHQGIVHRKWVAFFKTFSWYSGVILSLNPIYPFLLLS